MKTRNNWTTSRGNLEYSSQKKFHLTSYRNFRSLCIGVMENTRSLEQCSSVCAPILWRLPSLSAKAVKIAIKTFRNLGKNNTEYSSSKYVSKTSKLVCRISGSREKTKIQAKISENSFLTFRNISHHCNSALLLLTFRVHTQLVLPSNKDFVKEKVNVVFTE